MEWLILRNAGNNEKTNKSTESKHKIAKKNLDMYFLEFHYVSFNLWQHFWSNTYTFAGMASLK